MFDRHRVITAVLGLLFGGLLFSWPAILNGGAFYFADTSTYMRSADAGFVSLTGRKSAWSDRLVIAEPADPQSVAPKAAEQSRSGQVLVPTRPVLSGRSIYYGAYIFISSILLGTIGTAMLTGMIITATLVAILFPLLPSGLMRSWKTVAAVCIGASILTPLPFFASRLMPDVFSGLLVAALGSLILFWNDHRRWSRIWLIAVAAASVTFHSTHLMLAAVSGGAGLLMALLGKEHIRRPILLTAALIAAALLAQMAFSAAIKSKLGAGPITPPFLSARLIDDGPGYRHLRASCPQSGWTLCTLLDRLPQSSDTLLWSFDPGTGIFMAVPDAVMRKLAAEDKAFAFSVLRSRPGEVFWSSLGAVVRQTAMFELDHFNYVPHHIESMRKNLPDQIWREVRETAGVRGEVPVRPTEAITIVVTLISLLIAAVAILRAYPLGGPDRRVHRFALLLLLAMAANSVICGALSTPHARYQMRLIWLLPFAAFAIVNHALVLRRKTGETGRISIRTIL